MKGKGNIFRGLTAIMAFIMLISVTASTLTFQYATAINKALNVSTAKIVKTDENTVEDTDYYTTEFGTDIENKQAALKVEMAVAAENVRQAEEATVLLKNENQALPLTEGTGITVFGNGSVHSNASMSTNESIPTVTFISSLQDALGAENVNTVLADQVYAPLGTTTNLEVVEAPIADVKAQESAWQSSCNDAAVVMLTRVGGEGKDIAMLAGDGSHFMGLQANEKDLMSYLKQQKESGVFGKIIVVINSDHAMELGWLDEYSVDACVLAGVPGALGFEGVANVLTGKTSPSGHLVDTYAANSLSAPACTYANDNTQVWGNVDEVNATCTDITNGGVEIDEYVIYAEGIYVGYKYYETRYEDCVMGAGNANAAVGSSTGSNWSYGDEVVYSFGYGLSYTDFKQELLGVSYDPDTDLYNVEVKVTNTGDTAGKSVAQVYAQTPYGDYEKENKIEKSAVQFVGFEKTDVLQPGESVTLTVPVERYMLASYDSKGVAGYILSAGDYYLSVGDDAHDALNNILAAKGFGTADGMDAEGDAAKTYTWNLDAMDSDAYRTSRFNDTEVTNQFDKADLNYYGVDFTYLTRNDWEGTYPAEVQSVDATPDMMKDLDTNWYEPDPNGPAVSDFTQGVNNGMSLVDMRLVDYNDEETWNRFVDQLTVEEMAGLMPDTFGVAGIDSIGLPAQVRSDDGNGSGTIKATGSPALPWVTVAGTSRTWNKDLFASRGYYMGVEGVYCGLTELWYGGGNIHRTPFSGRTTLYNSEDGNFSYITAAMQAKAMQETGVIYCPKHFVLNDQETFRESLNTFATEQAIREEYLRAFEGPFCEGGALSVMTSFNKIGVSYTAATVNLLDHVLRGEWGFKGHVTTDGFSKSSLYKTHYPEMITAGLDFFCLDPGENAAAAMAAIEAGDGNILQSLRRSAKCNLYVASRSNVINGLSANSTVVTVVPAWQTALLTVNLVSALAFVVFGVLTVRSAAKTGKQKKEG